ncbi:ABC transporter permease subunit [Arthrobacter sp. AD-310]
MESRTTTAPSTNGRKPALSLGPASSVGALLLKVLVLGAGTGTLLWITPVLVAGSHWWMLAGAWLIGLAVFAAYLGRGALPAKYLLPGLVFLAVFMIVPIVYNLQISTTNFGDGTRTSKEETVATIVQNSLQPVPGSPAYTLTAGTTGSLSSGPFTFFLVDPGTGEAFKGTDQGLEKLGPGEAAVSGGRVTEVRGYTILTPAQFNAAGTAIRDLSIPADDGVIRPSGVSSAQLQAPRLEYDATGDTLRDTATGTTYTVQKDGDRSYFADSQGRRISDQSWQENVGLDNYVKLLADPVLRSAFIGSFAWTLVLATVSVLGSFVIGLLLAVALDRAGMRGRRFYRSVLIVPYAIPTFITFMVWSSFYNKDFGLINRLLGGAAIDWLGEPTLAKGAILVANLWAGFPYMFLICTGALQSLPDSVGEAAAIDGAGPVRGFLHVKLPLLLISVAPLLVASFAFNFNNFNAVQLLTGGGPFPPGAQIGETDILLSAVYRMAFGTSGAQFGLAAAGSTLLFLLTAVLAAIQFRSTRSLEEIQ